MDDILKILGIAGSLRKGSYNRSALRAAAKLVPQGAHLETFDLDTIPPFNSDLERELPYSVRAFKAAIQAADAILMLLISNNEAMTVQDKSFPNVLEFPDLIETSTLEQCC